MSRLSRSLIALSILLVALILAACEGAVSSDDPFLRLDKNSRGVTEAEIRAFDVCARSVVRDSSSGGCADPGCENFLYIIRRAS